MSKAEHMSWVIPYFMVADVARTIEMVRDIFGFEVIRSKMNESGKIMHAEFRYHDIVLMCGDAAGCGLPVQTPLQGGYHSPVCLYVYTNALSVIYDKVKQSPLKIEMALSDQSWGDRMFSVSDFDGHQWSFAEKIAV